MTVRHQQELTQKRCPEEQVAEYLKHHPDFFEQHLDLLSQLHIPHPCGGATSLIERQVEHLREQNRQIRRKLLDMVQVARDNDRLTERLHHLTLALVGAASLVATVQALSRSMKEDFNIETVVVHLFREKTDQEDYDTLEEKLYFTPEKGLPLKSVAGGLLTHGQPFCGQISLEQREPFFGKMAPHCHSLALILLGEKGKLGVLALGSQESDRFQNGMGTLFLTQISEILSVCLKSRC